jgi:hypothetical protein
MKWIWLGILGAVASGCAYDSGYYERSYYPPPAAETAPPVSTYSIPANDPRGSVHVLSLGNEQFPGQSTSYLHLRLAPENRSDDVAWTVDPNEQTLAGPSGSVKPSFAETSTGTPVLTLTKGSHGYMDVYYPAPAAGTRVSLAWKVRRGTEVASGSTEFDRVASTQTAYANYEPVAGPNVYVGLGWWWPSYYWWGDPYWWGWGGPWYWHYPYYGFHGGYYRGYYGHPYYGVHGYYGGARYYGGVHGGYGGGRVYVPSGGGWRGGGGGGMHAAPSGGGGGWRGGGGRR